MAATTITRATLTDWTGGVTGDTWNAALVGTALYDKIDALFTASLQIERSSAGDIALGCVNASNTAGSDASLSVSVGGSSGGDPSVVFSISGASAWAMGLDNSDSDLFKIAATGTLGSADVVTINSSAHMFINDTADGNVSSGLTINQGGNDNSLLAFKSSDVNHGITTQRETDTYGDFAKISAANGGVNFNGWSAGTQAILCTPVHTTDDTTKSTAGVGVMSIDAYLKSGTTVTGLGADANLLAVRTAGTTRFILDADGDSHQDVGTAWTNFDDHDDVALLHALSAGVSRDGDPLKHAFAGLLEQHRYTLSAQRIVTFNENGHHFINWSRAHMLLIGAVRQLGIQVADMQRRLPA